MTDRKNLEQELGTEQASAHGLAADLMAVPWQDRLRRVRADSRHHTPSFILLATTLARESERDTADRLNWAQLAVAAAEESDNLLAAELLPLAVAVLGNHHRVMSQLFEAGAAFARCRSLHRRIADPLDLAECLSLEASYLRVVRDFPRAEERLSKARRIAKKFGTARLQAKLDIQLGSVYADWESWSLAVTFLREGLEKAQELGDPKLALQAGHNLIGVLVEVGEHEWAAANLIELEPFYQRFGDAQLHALRDWLYGRIALGRAAYPEAEARLAKVRDSFLKADDTYYAALVQLDLAETQIALSDWQCAEASASAAAQALASCGSTAEALAAVNYLVEGVRDRIATTALRELVARARQAARAGS